MDRRWICSHKKRMLRNQESCKIHMKLILQMINQRNNSHINRITKLALKNYIIFDYVHFIWFWYL